MIRIDELINELCPNGVEFKALGEAGEFIRGNGLQKKDLIDEGVPAVHYGQIHTHYGVWATQTKSFVSEEVAVKLRRAKPGDLLIATTSEDDDAVAKATAWLGDTDVVLSGDAYIYRHDLDSRYVSYFFQTEQFQNQKRRYVSGTKVRRISGASLAKIKVPVPPIEVQREVVRILDEYSDLERDLSVQLEAELEARYAQFEHYRHLLVSALDAPDVTLKDIGVWYGGITPSKSQSNYWEDASVSWLTPKDMTSDVITETRSFVSDAALENTSLKLVPAGSVAFVMRSNVLRRRLPIAYVPIDVTLNQDMRAVVPNDHILPRYLALACQARSSEILAQAGRTDGSMAAIKSKAFLNFRIPFPPLEEQKKVVDLLDEFGSNFGDLSAELPAELNARRKQYEHYRDRLLTFKEATA